MGCFCFQASEGSTFLHKDRWKPLPLSAKEQLSHNSFRFVFALPSEDMTLGLPIGKHIVVKGKDSNGAEVTRQYTPTTLDSDKGRVELVIKIYPDGAMSRIFANLSAGDSLRFQGPKGRFTYEVNSLKAFGMLAGGTGIAPMYQVARAILENPEDNTSLHLVFANQTEKDILLREQLDKMAADHPKRFMVYYVLSKPDDSWSTGGRGHISPDMIRAQCPAPTPDIKILVCGPPAFDRAMLQHLNDMGYSKDQQFNF